MTSAIGNLSEPKCRCRSGLSSVIILNEGGVTLDRGSPAGERRAAVTHKSSNEIRVGVSHSSRLVGSGENRFWNRQRFVCSPKCKLAVDKHSKT